MDDNSIVELYLKRDEDVIRQTAVIYGSRLRALAFRIVDDFQTAEECENDTYLQAWNAIPPHEPRAYLYAFLARITRHIALNICRNRNRLKRKAWVNEFSQEMEQCLPAPDDMESRIDEWTLQVILNSFLSALDKEKRDIFIRRYFFLDTVHDISLRFGLSESKVKTTLFRLRKKLRSHLEKEGYPV